MRPRSPVRSIVVCAWLASAGAPQLHADEILDRCAELAPPIQRVRTAGRIGTLEFEILEARATPSSDGGGPGLHLSASIAMRNRGSGDDPMADRSVAWCGFVREGLYDPVALAFSSGDGRRLLGVPAGRERSVRLAVDTDLAPPPDRRLRLLFRFVEAGGGSVWIATDALEIAPTPVDSTYTK